MIEKNIQELTLVTNEKKEKKEVKVYTREEAVAASLEYFKGDGLAAEVWVSKYALKDSNENIYELTPNDMHKRIAKEFTAELQEEMDELEAETAEVKKGMVAEFAAKDSNDDMAGTKKVLTNTNNDNEEKLNLLAEKERQETIKQNEKEAREEKINNKPKKAGRPKKKGK